MTDESQPVATPNPISPEVQKLREKPLTDKALELMDYLASTPAIILSDLIGFERDDTLYSLATLERIEWRDLPFVFDKASVNALIQRKFMFRANPEAIEKHVAAIGEKIGKQPPHERNGIKTYLRSSEHILQIFVLSKDGKAALEAERSRLNDIYAEREARKANQRLVVAARYTSYSSRREQGAGMAYRIVRETPARIYIEDADLPNEHKIEGYGVVKGSPPNKYIERADVLATDVTVEQWIAMRRATDEFIASATRARSQRDEEIAPILRRHEQRQAQLLAQLEDEMRRAVSPDADVGLKR